jgi:hypothetical protein
VVALCPSTFASLMSVAEQQSSFHHRGPRNRTAKAMVNNGQSSLVLYRGRDIIQSKTEHAR